jgi:hypothetical protein
MSHRVQSGELGLRVIERDHAAAARAQEKA